MAWKKVHKELIESFERSLPEIVEGMKYGIPHIVGEITLNGSDPEVRVSVVTFERGKHPLVLREGDSIGFMYPVEDRNPYLTFLELMTFFEKKCVDGASFKVLTRKDPGEFLRALGAEVIWRGEYPLDGKEFVQVWAVSGNFRYNFLFEKTPKGFLLKDMKRIGGAQ